MTLPGPAWLFCPGDRPDRYAKAQHAADLVIIDLEDAVAAHNKDSARHALITRPSDPDRVIVRINPVNTTDHAADLAALAETDYRTVMLAKTEAHDDVVALAHLSVVALIETPLGVLNAAAVAAAPPVVALMWGAEDLVAAMFGRSSRHPNGRYRDVARHARSSVLIAAHASARAAVDAVYLDIPDRTGLQSEATDAAASGFSYKACIHPTQAQVVRNAFLPPRELVERAERILAAAGSTGVTTVDGQMVDAPLVRQAEQIIRASQPAGGGPPSTSTHTGGTT